DLQNRGERQPCELPRPEERWRSRRRGDAMMSRLLARVVIITAMLSGCTRLCVQKVPSDPAAASTVQGVRYSLPRTFLSLTPQADGTLTVEDSYLPDSQNTYAVQASS